MLSRIKIANIRKEADFTKPEIDNGLLSALHQSIEFLVQLYKPIMIPEPLKKDAEKYRKYAYRRSLSGRRAVSDELYILYLFLSALEKEKLQRQGEWYLAPVEALEAIWDPSTDMIQRNNNLVFAALKANLRIEVSVQPVLHQSTGEVLGIAFREDRP